jgi:hypothetical protein
MEVGIAWPDKDYTTLHRNVHIDSFCPVDTPGLRLICLQSDHLPPTSTMVEIVYLVTSASPYVVIFQLRGNYLCSRRTLPHTILFFKSDRLYHNKKQSFSPLIVHFFSRRSCFRFICKPSWCVIIKVPNSAVSHSEALECYTRWLRYQEVDSWHRPRDLMENRLVINE